MSITALNRTLKRSTKRAEKLEARFIRVLTPILNKAADQAADRFEKLATDPLTADASRGVKRSSPITAAADVTGSSTMVAVMPRPDEQNQLAVEGGEPADMLHVTLAFLGDTDEDQVAAIVDALKTVAATHGPLAGKVAGTGVFQNGDEPPWILLPDVPGLVELRVAITEALLAAGIDYSRQHGFQPHITIEYSSSPLIAPLAARAGMPLHFDDLVIARGGDVQSIPLVGVPPVTAAANWGAPAADELIDAEALVKTLRTKTDPVRLAVIETTAKSSLAAADIAWDATNPFVKRIMAQTGSQIVNIAKTTQANVMGIIEHAYEQGLSIPDTATAIRAGMKSATLERATLIARTEMAAAVNGGSLAAAQIYSDQTETPLYKEWLTAPGAQYPRHEEYDGLDGQIVGMEEYFDVGGFDLQHPGDPDGPPEEVCNCRCTMAYVDSPDGGEEIDSGIGGEG